MHTPLPALSRCETEVAHLLQVDRWAIRRQARATGTALNECVAYVAEHAHRCHNAAAHAPAGISSNAIQQEGA